jgi:hypothetical protein
MSKTLFPAALAAAMALVALPAAAQSTFGPTPNEQVSMFTGTTAANGAATIVTDRTGTHPDGYTGMAVQNSISAANPPAPSLRHHKHHRTTDAPLS